MPVAAFQARTLHSRYVADDGICATVQRVKQLSGMDMRLSSKRALAVVVATVALATAAPAADITLRFSSAAPPSDFLAKSIETFKAEVEKANVGLKVESYPASTLFKQAPKCRPCSAAILR